MINWQLQNMLEDYHAEKHNYMDNDLRCYRDEYNVNFMSEMAKIIRELEFELRKNESITEVSIEKIADIIETRKPLGRFMTIDQNKFIGCDNTKGEAWTEEFNDRFICIKWLILK